MSLSLDALPLWGVSLLTVGVVLLSISAGYPLGARARRRENATGHAAGTAQGSSILGLLAFLLAFTFSMAGSRFDLRKQLVVSEANAIGTAYLRAGMLPVPHGHEIRALLREYVAARIEGTSDLARLARAIQRSEELHGQLWAEATIVASKQPNPVVGLFIQSLNELIDLHAERISAVRDQRVPPSIWLALLAVAVLAMLAMGYEAGHGGAPRLLLMALVTAGFSAVILLIVDLDRPWAGWLRVSQQPMIDAQRSMHPEEESN